MANVKQVKVCKHCGASDLPDPLPNFCMECGAPISSVNSALFSEPNYLTSQRRNLLSALEEGERLSPGDYDKRLLEIGNELTRLARQAPFRWQLGCLFDGKLFLENLLHSRATRTEVAEVVKLGQAIGTISNAISEYLKSGGKHNDRKVGQVPPVSGDFGGRQDTAG